MGAAPTGHRCVSYLATTTPKNSHWQIMEVEFGDPVQKCTEQYLKYPTKHAIAMTRLHRPGLAPAEMASAVLKHRRGIARASCRQAKDRKHPRSPSGGQLRYSSSPKTRCRKKKEEVASYGMVCGEKNTL